MPRSRTNPQFNADLLPAALAAAGFGYEHIAAAGLARLRTLAADAPMALMCAEALWWRCHRRIIADYLRRRR